MSRPVCYVVHSGGKRFTVIQGDDNEVAALAHGVLTNDPSAVIVTNELNRLTAQVNLVIEHGRAH